MRILIFHPKSQEFDCNSWESIYMSCWIFMERLKHLVVQLCFSFYPFTSMFSVVVWLLLPKVLPKLFFPLFFSQRPALIKCLRTARKFPLFLDIIFHVSNTSETRNILADFMLVIDCMLVTGSFCNNKS